jgi:hypothetical protein
MNFYIKKNSTLPVLTVEVVVDSRTTFGNTNESFSASTITFSMKDIYTDFYYIIGHPVSVKEKYTTEDSPLKSYYLEVQFTERQVSKIGNFVGEFKIENNLFTEIIPIEDKIFINIIESFVDPDSCCIEDDAIIFPTETPRPSITPSPSPAPPIGCNDSLTASGNIGYYVVDAEIGEETGLVSVIFNSFTVPDRFMILFDGVIVADSSFVGDGLVYDGNNYIPTILSTTSLNKYQWNGNSFTNVGVESVNFTNDDINDCTILRSDANTNGNQFGVDTSYPSPNSSNCDGNVKLDFIKNTTTSTMTIIAIGCNSGTGWDIVEVVCPTTPPTPSITPTITPTSVTPTVTPTISVTPSTTPVYFLNCDIVYNIPTGTTSNGLTSTIELFTPFTQGRGVASFTYNKPVLESIKNNDYKQFGLGLPLSDGSIINTVLQKTNYSKNEIVKSTNGDREEVSIVNPQSNTYRVIYNDEVIGSVLISDNKVNGLYQVDGEVIKLGKSTNTLHSAWNSSTTIEAGLSCGTNEYDDVEEVNPSQNDFIKRTLNSNEKYCFNMVYDIPKETYADIIQEGGTIQDYVEFVNFALNAYYEPDFAGDIEFILAGWVEWNGSDPWDVNQDGYTQRDQVGQYYMNNHNTLLPGVEYNLIQQLHKLSTSGLRGLSRFLGAYVTDIDTNFQNVSLTWSVNPEFPFTITNNTSDSWVNAHEVGHAVLGLHTWNSGTVYSSAVGGTWVGGSTAPCNCNSCCVSNTDCHTIMSYCPLSYNVGSSVYSIMKFQPARVNDFYNIASQYGQHLICSSTPETPYFEISLDTNITSSSFNYTVEFKNCFDGDWYTYGTNFNYDDFNLLVPISDIPFSADCYEYRVTVQEINKVCQGYIYPYQTTSTTPPITPTSTPTPSATPSISITPSITPSISVTPSITQTNTPTISITPSITQSISVTPTISTSGTISGINTIFIHYNNI